MATVTDLIRLYGSGFHVEVPYFNRQVVAGHHVSSAVAELDVRDGRDDFREEGAIVWILWLFEHLRQEKLFHHNHKLHLINVLCWYVSRWGTYKSSVFAPSSNEILHLAWLSHSADALMSHMRMVPLLLLYTKVLHWLGWNSAAVMTSVSSSMLAGLMSTISEEVSVKEPNRHLHKIKMKSEN